MNDSDIRMERHLRTLADERAAKEQTDTTVREALQACLDAMVPIIALVTADPYRAGLGYQLLTEHADKMIAAMAQARRAMKS